MLAPRRRAVAAAANVVKRMMSLGLMRGEGGCRRRLLLDRSDGGSSGLYTSLADLVTFDRRGSLRSLMEPLTSRTGVEGRSHLSAPGPVPNCKFRLFPRNGDDSAPSDLLIRVATRAEFPYEASVLAIGGDDRDRVDGNAQILVAWNHRDASYYVVQCRNQLWRIHR